MTTTYYIEHNGVYIDQDTSMELLWPRLQDLIKNNPTQQYHIAIDGPGNPLTPYVGPKQPTTTGTNTI
jgi:hypothetical protein